MNIIEVVKKCFEVRTEQKELKKLDENYSTQIKDFMRENNTSEIDGGSVIASLSIVEKLELDEEMLIDFLKTKIKTKELSPAIVKKIIKKKEYIDLDALEKVIYKGELSAQLISPCQRIKTSERLNFKKGK